MLALAFCSDIVLSCDTTYGTKNTAAYWHKLYKTWHLCLSTYTQVILKSSNPPCIEMNTKLPTYRTHRHTHNNLDIHCPCSQYRLCGKSSWRYQYWFTDPWPSVEAALMTKRWRNFKEQLQVPLKVPLYTPCGPVYILKAEGVRRALIWRVSSVDLIIVTVGFCSRANFVSRRQRCGGKTKHLQASEWQNNAVHIKRALLNTLNR